MRMRIGHGFDAHRFGPGDAVVLGGVRIPFHRGLEAHSDGDAAIHALCDALLGAAGLGDIGRHFPDSDPALAGIDSRELLRAVVEAIGELGLEVGNVDLTVVAQAPRLGPHIPHMVRALAEDLRVATQQVNVKATTTEGMGYVGREEGVCAHAVVILTEAASADARE